MIRQLIPTASSELDEVDLETRYGVGMGPHLRCNFVVGLDGAIELEGRSGGLGGPADRAVFITLRALADVVLVGSGTARLENYGPVLLNPERQSRRVARSQPARPPLAIVSDSAAVNPGARALVDVGDGVSEARPIVIVAGHAPEERVAALRPVADVIVTGEERVDLSAAIDVLADRGLNHVLCEGGPTIMGRLIAAGRMDELCLTHSPWLSGPGRMHLAGPVPYPPVSFRLDALFEGDGLLLGRYTRLAAGDDLAALP